MSDKVAGKPFQQGISDSHSRLEFSEMRGCCLKVVFREKQRGVENSGEGKTYHKTPSQKRFWTPPPMIRFPPRLFSPCCFPYRKPAHTRQIPLSEPSKTGFGGRTLWYVSPPPKLHDTFCPPISRFPRFRHDEAMKQRQWRAIEGD